MCRRCRVKGGNTGTPSNKDQSKKRPVEEYFVLPLSLGCHVESNSFQDSFAQLRSTYGADYHMMLQMCQTSSRMPSASPSKPWHSLWYSCMSFQYALLSFWAHNSGCR